MTCAYNTNESVFEQDVNSPLVLESTRSKANEAAYRDMDGFDVNEELRRLRRAIHEVRRSCLVGSRTKWVLPEILNYGTAEEYSKLLAFISEASSNIDEWLRRLGSAPASWTQQTEKCDRHSPEVIIEILRSITGISRDSAGGVDFTFDGGKQPEVATSFIPGSFTRQILELIEEHLKE